MRVRLVAKELTRSAAHNHILCDSACKGNGHKKSNRSCPLYFETHPNAARQVKFGVVDFFFLKKYIFNIFEVDWSNNCKFY